jgi:Mn2+/Fe2+ NRAMP family transporter
MTVTELPVEPVAPQAGASAPEPRKKFSLLKIIGPGVVTGASDDDPSGIGTYSQAGAQLGFSISWTMVLTFPLMVAIQKSAPVSAERPARGSPAISASIIPRGSSRFSSPCYSGPTSSISVPISPQWPDALKLLIGGSGLLYVILFGIVCVVGPTFLDYKRYVRVLKWSCLSLFAYLAALATVKVPWGEALKGLVVPTLTWNTDYFTTLVAIAGTTISPYLFFWQAAQEAEDVRVKPERQALLTRGWQAATAFARIRADTAVGMGFSNLIAVAIIMTTAATLYAHGMTNIQSSSQAAEALRPIAGSFAAIIFTAGIVGTGLLAVPVLAGSAAYAVSEAAGWPVGLARLPRNAIAFYSTLALSMLIGIGLNFTPINPISALYWSAVVNGVAAVPIMVLLMIMTARRRVMGEFTIGHGLKILGWAATVAMVACVVGMVVTALV